MSPSRTSEHELKKWKLVRKQRRKFQRKLAQFAMTCDVDTVIVSDEPEPRVLCYLVFRVTPDYRITYEESLLVRAIGAPVYMVVASATFSVFEVDLSLRQFHIYEINIVDNEKYELSPVLSDVTWLDIRKWTEELKKDESYYAGRN